MSLRRASFLKLAAAATLAGPAHAQSPAAPAGGHLMDKRKIPATGELLPVVGCGTWQTFDISNAPAERTQRGEVLKALLANDYQGLMQGRRCSSR